MDSNRVSELDQRIVLIDFLSSLFLTLPDEALLNRLFELQWDESESAGSNEIAAYIDERRNADREEVLLELGRDRARLMRGANNEGMRSAYESLYSSCSANESIGSLNRFYADAGFAVSEEIHDAVDQLGIEIAFLSVLMKREREALAQGDATAAAQWREQEQHFMEQHLSRWAHEYAADMRSFAQTGFYRGVGMLIDEALL